MKTNHPPRWALRFLTHMADPLIRDSALGDMEERFHMTASTKGAIPALAGCVLQLLFMFPAYLKNHLFWSLEMFKNYLKIAVRLFKRHKGYSFLNLAGLAVGMACCILILLWVRDELSFDRFHSRADRIYRLTYAEEIGGDHAHYALAPFISSSVFADEVPEIQAFSRLWKRSGIFKHKDRVFEEDDLYYADAGFFDLFDFPLIHGSTATALKEPGSVVLTESIAHKIFGTADPVGKTINLNADGDLKVTGVVRDVPANSHFRFNSLISMESLPENRKVYLQEWLVIVGWNYILLSDGADPVSVAEKINAVAQRHAGEEARSYGQTMEYFLQPLTDIHLHSTLSDEIAPQGNILYVYVFSLVALFILVIACINFMNLSTARSAGRGREVGIRKVFGAQKNRLVGQFVSESVFLSLIGLLAAVGLALSLLPAFNSLTGKTLGASDLLKPVTIGGFLGLVLLTGFFAGSYPAFVLSSFRPIDVLRSRVIGNRGGAGLRHGLVTFQFVISVFLIISTFIILGQIGHMKHAPLGFDKEQVLVLRVRGAGFRNNAEAFKNALLQSPFVLKASYSSGVPGDVNNIFTIMQEGKSDEESHSFYFLEAGWDFLDTYGITLTEGRDFSREFVSDAGGVIINETAAQKLGWGNDAIGRRIGTSRDRMEPIIGIMKDFHYRSLHEEIAPLVIIFSQDPESRLSLRLRTENLTATMSFIEDTWSRFEKERKPVSFFVDERFDDLYRAEERLSRIISVFAALAVFVACLGLFGLASYTVQQSTKEIGIRKVLGASTSNIVLRLSKIFLRWVLLANIIAWPLAYYIMTVHWLRRFPFRIGINPLLFVGAGILSLVIALLTVGVQSIRAAVANPIDSLRME